MSQPFWRTPFSIVTLTHSRISCNSAPLKCIYPLLSFPLLSTPFQLYWYISTSIRVERAVTKAAAKVLHYLCPQLSKTLEHCQHWRHNFIICLAQLQHALHLFLNIKHFLTRLPFCLAAFWRILKDFFLSCSACSYLKAVICSVRRMSNVASISLLEKFQVKCTDLKT